MLARVGLLQPWATGANGSPANGGTWVTCPACVGQAVVQALLTSSPFPMHKLSGTTTTKGCCKCKLQLLTVVPPKPITSCTRGVGALG